MPTLAVFQLYSGKPLKRPFTSNVKIVKYSRLHLIAKFVLLQKKLKHRSIYHSFNVKTTG